MNTFILDISEEKQNWSSSFGDRIEFDKSDGCLSINLYDGHTLLNKEEAIKLGEVLINWGRT